MPGPGLFLPFLLLPIPACLPQELIQVPSPPPPSLRSPAPVIGPNSQYCYYSTLSLRVYDLLKCFLQTRAQAFFKHVPLTRGTPNLNTKERNGVREGIRLQLSWSLCGGWGGLFQKLFVASCPPGDNFVSRCQLRVYIRVLSSAGGAEDTCGSHSPCRR